MRRLAMVALVLGLAGCFVVSPEHRDEVLGGGTDGGGTDSPTTPDAGNPNILVDRCGDETADYEVLRDTRPSFIVDTRELTNRVGTCGTVGSSAAPGNDGFLAVEVGAGDRWHFHVLPDPGTPGQIRDPFLYLIQGTGGSCDTRGCAHRSNQCTGVNDEHFAFVAPTAGIWYLGIDDALEGGGVYEVNAFRLNCGDDMDGHGEGCDHGVGGSTTCNTVCQEILSAARPAEIEANDNNIEANFVEIDTGVNTVTISGNIGGDTCTYPDVYTFRVPDPGNYGLSVAILKSDGSLCDSGALTPFDIVLYNTADDVVAGPMTDGVSGCSELEVSGLSAAAYNLYLEHATPIDDRVVPYQLRITITPP